jgi:hypothetical protein
MVDIISDFGLGGGDLASTGISHGNSTIRIFGIYPEISGIYPPQKNKPIVLETVVVVRNTFLLQRRKRKAHSLHIVVKIESVSSVVCHLSSVVCRLSSVVRTN